MGLRIVRTVAELGEGLVLSPERFDPRRDGSGRGRPLGEVASISAESAPPRAFAGGPPVLVLDTTHAYEGFVVLRHGPSAPDELGSSKRRLRPGDVVVSRLRPYLRQIAYVDEALFSLARGGNEVAASTEFFVLRAGVVDPAGLVPFLLSAPVQRALSAGQEGGHHPRFARELLASLPVPDEALTRAPEAAAEVRALAAAVRGSLLSMQALAEAAGQAQGRGGSKRGVPPEGPVR